VPSLLDISGLAPGRREREARPELDTQETELLFDLDPPFPPFFHYNSRSLCFHHYHTKKAQILPGAFGLLGDPNPSHFPGDRLVERNQRIDVWGKDGHRPTREGNVWLNGTLLTVCSDRPMPHVRRLWWSCPSCGSRSRYLYLRETIACARCHSLQNASRHLRRQTPQVRRIEKLRKKLGGCELAPFAPLPARRRGQRRAYFNRLVSAILDEEERLLAHLGGVVHDLKRRVRLRKAKGKW
jgi:hypothetical protein